MSTTTTAELPPNSTPSVMILDWKDVAASETSESLLADLEQALSPGGMGLVAIRNVPGLVECKDSFLPMAHQLVSLDPEYLETKLTDPDTLYNAGWSHGKEQLKENQPDLSKGSFYYNPLTDTPGTPADRQAYPLSYPCNIWPDETLLPNFRERACRMGTILTHATAELAKHIDSLAAQKVPNYPPQFLYQSMKDTEKAKARLLYYFPLDKKQNEDKTTIDNENTNIPDETIPEDSWIGWHNDSGFLTALSGDIYVDHATGRVVDCPDPEAGLYVVDRTNVARRVELPSDCMAVQIGECTQILTGGAVVATPHCVRGCRHRQYPGIARISLPCFVDTPPSFPLNLPPGATREQVLQAGLQSKRVPPLAKRWKEGMTFGEFLAATFSLYYSWTKE